MNNLKFKVFADDKSTINEKLFKHLDGTSFIKGQELLFTKLQPSLQIDSTDMIDLQNLDTIYRHLKLSAESVQLQEFIDAFGIKKDELSTSGRENIITRQQTTINLLSQSLAVLYLQFLNIILYDIEKDGSYRRCEKIDYDSAIQILKIYIPDFSELFQTIIQAKINGDDLIQKIAMAKQKKIEDVQSKLGQGNQHTQKIVNQIKQKKDKKSIKKQNDE